MATPCTILIGLILAVYPDSSESAGIDFQTQIRPILSRACFGCHGPDENDRKGDLRLDTREGLFHANAPAESYAPVVPHDLEHSEVWNRISATSPSDRMPPQESGRSLSDGEIATLKRWIEAGAPFQEHWSFRAPTTHDAPDAKAAAWGHVKHDAFVLARLSDAGLAPNAEEEPRRLFRRLAIDLTGLPPAPSEVEAFATVEPGQRDAAYRAAIDRLLASPAYGERFARVFLDLFRHADTKGYEKDLRRSIWPFRDWLIRALEADLPYPQFTERVLAGDLLPNATQDDRVASAMHRNTMANDEGGTDDEEFRVSAVKDRVDTTMTAWLGLTVGCAKCHSHKYDPISQTEYYRLYAFFDQTEDADRYDDTPTEPYLMEADGVERERIDHELSWLRALDARRALEACDLDLPHEGDALHDTIVALEARRPHPVALPILRELPPDKRRTTRVQIRGNFQDLGDTVTPDTPSFLPPFPANEPRNRLGLARWLTANENPLAARVLVNRIWAQFFGRGLVETEEDFGSQGSPPSHRELLDDLATRFMANGWSLKWLCREIASSATYRQSAVADDLRLVRDPGNRLYSRGPRQRLDAEMVRDQALAVSGLLSNKRFGPPVMPRQPDGIWAVVYSDDKWVTSPGEDAFRRSLYTFVRRTSAYPALLTFDAPTRETCTARRIATNTPLQALVTLNDPVFVECAQGLARTAFFVDPIAPPDAIAARMFRSVTGREPSAHELGILSRLYRERLDHYRFDRDAAIAAAEEPLGALPNHQHAIELAAWSNVGNVLLNLDEVLTR